MTNKMCLKDIEIQSLIKLEAQDTIKSKNGENYF